MLIYFGVHTFLAKQFLVLAHHAQDKHDALEREAGRPPSPSVRAEVLHFLGEIEVVFGGATATLAYDGSGSGSCRVFFEVNLNGKQVGGGEVSTEATVLQQVEQSIGAQPQIDPPHPITNHLTVRTSSNGDCTPDSVIDSARFRVLDFG